MNRLGEYIMPPVPPDVNVNADDSRPVDLEALSQPAGSAAVDPFAFLGQPFATYANLRIAADDAKGRLWSARVSGDANTVRVAELGYADACHAVTTFQHHTASTFLMCARFVANLFPGALQAILDPVFRRELDRTQDAVRDCEDRIEDVEDAVVRLEQGEGVPA